MHNIATAEHYQSFLREHVKHRPGGEGNGGVPTPQYGFAAFTLIAADTAKDMELPLLSKTVTNDFIISPELRHLIEGLSAGEFVTLASMAVAVPQDVLSVADCKAVSKAATRSIVEIDGGQRDPFLFSLKALTSGQPSIELTDDDDAAVGGSITRMPMGATPFYAFPSAFHMEKDDKLAATLRWPGATLGTVAADSIIVVEFNWYLSTSKG